MNDNLERLIETANRFCYLVTHHMEVAEANLAEIEKYLATAREAGQLEQLTLLGPAIIQGRGFRPKTGSGESQIGQVAVLADRGPGLIWWNAADFNAAQQRASSEPPADLTFVSFNACSPLLKALMVWPLHVLLIELERRLRARSLSEPNK